jgi:hypothetical protein
MRCCGNPVASFTGAATRPADDKKGVSLTARHLAPPAPFEAMRDPFAGAAERGRPAVAIEDQAPQMPELKVDAIYLAGPFRAAVINGRIWVEGQSGRVVPDGPMIHISRITERSVEIESDAGIVVLRLIPPMERGGRALAAPSETLVPLATPRDGRELSP